MSDSILPGFVWKLLEIWDIRFRGYKYHKINKCHKWNMKWKLKNLKNKNISKFAKFWVHSNYCFQAIKSFASLGQK